MPQRPGPPPPPPGGPRATELATSRVLPLGSQDAAPDEDSKDHEADDDVEEEYDAATGKAAGLEDMSDDGEGEGSDAACAVLLCREHLRVGQSGGDEVVLVGCLAHLRCEEEEV